MGKLTDLVVGRGAAINLADDWLAGGIADVVEPSLDGDFGSGLRQVPERDHAGVERLVGPGNVLEFARNARDLLWIEAWADHVDDAGER